LGQIGKKMAHDNYDKFYTWDKGTLILDPGIFAWDEPHLQVCDQPLAHANAFDHLARPDLSKWCHEPARLLAMDHLHAPRSVRAKCDTLEPGQSYCCPHYAMPENWRVDYMPIGMGQEDTKNGNLMSEADMYALRARKIADNVRARVEPAAEAMSDEAIALYKFLRGEVGLVAREVEVTAEQAEDVVEEAPVVGPAVHETRKAVRKWPIVSIGLGIAGGLLLGKMLRRRGL
jgi:hypothetical protein